ncbi:MAG: flagellar biosynthesis protein FlhB [Candidatus Kryptonium sp.]|nr:flagellar biosynthesis protein FlhB [Candidatus Kryptonium sp.]MCX7762796.1 flagellar biosynthesis protein FlhB [Candidatus Kryptonium sp.]MDW8109247.1 flagellar biosynthesis protein FlhB [Candidatus Kryptonium sp.]
MPEELQERTEQATPKRREDARKKGKVARSYEFNSSIVLLTSIAIFYFGGSFVYQQIANLTSLVLSNLHKFEITPKNVSEYTFQIFSFLAINFFPFMVLLTLVGVGGSIIQTGYVFTLEPLKFDLEKLNPITGIKKIFFSKRSLFELVKGFFKILVIGFTAYLVLRNMVNDVIVLIDSDVRGISDFIVGSAFSLMLKTGIVYFLIAIFDFVFQKWEYERELKMTRQEVKEETKELEGDPLVKSRIRKRQIEISKRRMMQNVPKADVVITNPTHIAVALKYESKKMNAPKVVAKGMNLIAEKIKEIARAHGVPIVEDKPLAQALYKMVDIDEEIPPQLYKAVAKVLAYVYQLKKKSSSVLQ